MEPVRRIRKTDVARTTREVINSVMRGQTALIESHGKAEAAIIDIEDYLILRSVTRYHAFPPHVDVEAGLSATASRGGQQPAGTLRPCPGSLPGRLDQPGAGGRAA